LPRSHARRRRGFARWRRGFARRRRGLAYYPSLIYIRRGGVILNEAALGITSALNYGYVHHLDGFFV
jgi:hypothetical protein